MSDRLTTAAFEEQIVELKQKYEFTLFDGIEYVFESHRSAAIIVCEYIDLQPEQALDPDSGPIQHLFKNTRTLMAIKERESASIVDFLQLYEEFYTYVKQAIYTEVHITDDPWDTLNSKLEEISTADPITETVQKEYEYPSDIVEQKLSVVRELLTVLTYDTEPSVGEFFVYTLPDSNSQYVCGKITGKKKVPTRVVAVTVYEFDLIQYTNGAKGSQFVSDGLVRPKHSSNIELYNQNPIFDLHSNS